MLKINNLLYKFHSVVEWNFIKKKWDFSKSPFDSSSIGKRRPGMSNGRLTSPRDLRLVYVLRACRSSFVTNTNLYLKQADPTDFSRKPSAPSAIGLDLGHYFTVVGIVRTGC